MYKMDDLISIPYGDIALFSQVEDTFQDGQEKNEQQEKENIKGEDNAIEMTEDFDGQMYDRDDNEPGNSNCLGPVDCTLYGPLILVFAPFFITQHPVT